MIKLSESLYVSASAVKPPSPPPMRVGDGVSRYSKLAFYPFHVCVLLRMGNFLRHADDRRLTTSERLYSLAI